MKLLFKLLRQNVSVGQLFGFVVVNLLGGLIVLFGVQGYRDYNLFSNSGDRLVSSGSLVVTKPVGLGQTIGSALGWHTSFSNREIEELEKISSVSSVGRFVSAQFEVKASFAIGHANVSTDIFLEAVPDEFIQDDYNVVGDRKHIWSASVDSDTVPIIIPRNYLNLYNYGYATANGMPQICDDLLDAFPMKLRLMSPEGWVVYDAVVCGLTNKINTILVPWDFIQEANTCFAPDVKALPARLMLVTNTMDPDDSLLEYIEKKGYVLEGDSSHVRLQSFVSGLIVVVIGVGLLFSFLAFFLLVISIMLLIEKNKDKIINLYSIGYSVSGIARVYQLLSLVVDVVVWLVAAVVASFVYPAFTAMMQRTSPGFVPVSFWGIWCVAFVLAVLFVVLHCVVVYRHVKRHCKGGR